MNITGDNRSAWQGSRIMSPWVQILASCAMDMLAVEVDPGDTSTNEVDFMLISTMIASVRCRVFSCGELT